MNVLAVDTSGEALGLCLTTSDGLELSVAHRIGLRHAQTTLIWIERLLRQAELRPAALDLVVCCSGPGSFTGVRIGMATAKGLCLAAPAPLVTVASLDALAGRHVAYPGLVVPVIDAKKERYYAAVYRAGRRLGEYLDTPAMELVRHIPDGETLFLAGPAASAVAQALRLSRTAVVADPAPTHTEPSVLLRLGRARFEADGADREPVTPLYVRPSEAELGRRRQ